MPPSPSPTKKKVLVSGDFTAGVKADEAAWALVGDKQTGVETLNPKPYILNTGPSSATSRRVWKP